MSIVNPNTLTSTRIPSAIISSSLNTVPEIVLTPVGVVILIETLF
jgi:hypothetical protein